MKIGIFSQNLANERSIDTAPPSLPEPDIYVEFTQENYLDGYVQNGSLLPTSLPFYSYYQLNQAPLSSRKKESTFNVILKVFAKSGLITGHESGRIPMNSFSGKGFTGSIKEWGSQVITNVLDYSRKGAVWTHIYTEKENILFVNMHLPVDPSSSDMGNEYRIECFRRVLTELYPRLNNTLLLLGGDMNFRVEERKFRVEERKDQLTELLKEFPALYELSRTEETCKFTTKCGNQSRCFDTTRTPSRCDRILANKPLRSTSDSIVLDPKLDHNGIYVIFDTDTMKNELNAAYLNTPIQNAGRRTRRQSRRRKRSTKARR